MFSLDENTHAIFLPHLEGQEETTLADEPSKVYAGDTVTWASSQADYPATAGWTLTYYLAIGTEIPADFAATAQGSDFLVTIPAATTAGWAPGTIHWVARVSKDTEVYTVGEGTIDVLPNPQGAYDRRTHAEKCLAAVTAVLEGLLADPITEYEIDGVKAKKIPHEQLVKLRAHYASLVRRQKGGGTFRQIPVRFWP